MRDIKIIVSVERGIAGESFEEAVTVRVDDDATQEDIESACQEEAETIFFNTCSYGWVFAGGPA